MKNLLIISLLIFSFISLEAQTYEATVTDDKDNPVSFALITAPKYITHTHSDDDGRFRLTGLSLGDTLEISHLSYEPQTVIIETFLLQNIILEESNVSLDAIVISNELTSTDILSEVDTKIKPVNSSQELLTKMTGLFIGQHAGGGKAEQIFLRGFDIDHGTDINITADGIPVNMVSHAHGQGYADLHFLIPETIESIDFGLGPYHADQGNFNTAGYVDFSTRNNINENLLKLEYGQNETMRVMSMLELFQNENNNAYIAGEYLYSNGPFISPQNFIRTNIIGKYSSQPSLSTSLNVSLSHFNSSWDASGQIPERAVNDGTITRLGAIDDTEGGYTSRSNIIVDHMKFLDANSVIKSKIYLSNYNFQLFSNFTFFLEDEENGDQIMQKENRFLYGVNIEYSRSKHFSNISAHMNIGLDFRADKSLDNQLANTLNRNTVLNYVQKGDISENNLGTYLDIELDFGKFKLNPSARVDQFFFTYLDKLSPTYTNVSASKSIVSPKMSLFYNLSKNLQFYSKFGKGFHTNDARAFITDDDLKTIPAAYGYDLGAVWKPITSLLLNMTYWNLFLEQEFVYVGDAGVIEPSRETLRKGFDISMRYQPLEWLYISSDINYTIARSLNVESSESFIPLAPHLALKTGATIKHNSGFGGSLDVRHLADRPANEDNSIIATGYTVVDLSANYSFHNLSIVFQIQNLLNTEWNETQFATESRLFDEKESTTEIHFTPGTPLFVKGILEYRF